MRYLLFALVILSLAQSSCTMAPKLEDTTKLLEGQRLIVGEIEIVFDDIKRDIGGAALTNIQLLIGTKEQLGWLSQKLARVDCDMQRNGCAFQVAFTKEEFYIHSIKTDAMTLWVHRGKLWPLYSKVLASDHDCEYIGSFQVAIKDGRVMSQIRNRIANVAKHPKLSLGSCKLKVNLAKFDDSVPKIEKRRRVEKTRERKIVPKNSI